MPVPRTSLYDCGNIAVVCPWYTPIAPELMLPLTFGLRPKPTSMAQREGSLELCAKALALANRVHELMARARTRRRIRMEDSFATSFAPAMPRPHRRDSGNESWVRL